MFKLKVERATISIQNLEIGNIFGKDNICFMLNDFNNFFSLYFFAKLLRKTKNVFFSFVHSL